MCGLFANCTSCLHTRQHASFGKISVTFVPSKYCKYISEKMEKLGATIIKLLCFSSCCVNCNQEVINYRETQLM